MFDRFRQIIPIAVVVGYARVGAMVLIGVAGALTVGSLGLIAVSQLTYPLPIDFIEGGLVLETNRLLTGSPLYTSPSLSYTPFIYPPLYFYVSAAVASVTGIGYFPLRLVSLVATVASVTLIWYLIKYETGRHFLSLAAVTLFLVTYELTNAWYFVARPDMLFLSFLLAGAVVVRTRSSGTAGIIAAVLFALSFWTKQAGLLALLLFGVYAALRKPRRFLVRYAATGVLLVPVAAIAYNIFTDGWFFYYVFRIPIAHETIYSQFLFFWREDIFGPVSIAATLAAFYLVYTYDQNQYDELYYLFTGAALVGTAYQMRLHSGGAENVLISAYAGIAILGTLAIWKLLNVIDTRFGVNEPRANLWQAFVYGLVVFQVLTLVFAPFVWVPPADTIETGDQFKSCLGDVDGEAYVSVAPYLAFEAGKGVNAHGAAVVDVLRTTGMSEPEQALRADIRDASRDGRYSAIILNQKRSDAPWQSQLIERYNRNETLSANCSVELFIPQQRVPDTFYTPNRTS